MTDFSIIIPSFNTKEVTLQTIESVKKYLTNVSAEIIVVDNASTDGSVEALQKRTDIVSLLLPENLGYSKANNKGLEVATGTYILFLNSDIVTDNVDFEELKMYMDEHQDVGALTVKVSLPEGGIDPASHRGFPTVWRSFCYYSKLEKVFGNIPLLNSIFGGYHLLDQSLNTIHEIDSPTGAFFLTRKSLMNELKGFDETFFMYGEDLDLSYRIKEKGYKIIYYPNYQVTHLKYKSGLGNTSEEVRRKIKHHFYDAMKILYNKHYKKKYPTFITKMIYSVIDFKASRA